MPGRQPFTIACFLLTLDPGLISYEFLNGVSVFYFVSLIEKKNISIPESRFVKILSAYAGYALTPAKHVRCLLPAPAVVVRQLVLI